MGMQYDAGRHVFENRRESVILYDGEWYKHVGARDKCLIFGNGADPIQSVELDKAYLGFLVAFFDNPDNRKAFHLDEFIRFASREIDSEQDLDKAIKD